jgi:hypothetical protein
MKKSLVVILIIVLSLVFEVILIGCSKQPVTVSPIISPSSILIRPTPSIWQNVTIFTDPKVTLLTQVNQPFALEFSYRPGLTRLSWKCSDPGAFSEIADKGSNQSTFPPTGIQTIDLLFKANKAGTFQVTIFTEGKTGIEQSETFNIIVNP